MTLKEFDHSIGRHWFKLIWRILVVSPTQVCMERPQWKATY